MSVDISQDFLFLWLIKKQRGLRSSSSLDVRGSRLWGSEPKGKFAIWLLQKQLPRALFNALPLPETLKDVNPIGRFWPPEKMPSSWTHKSYFNCLIWNRAILKRIPTRIRPAAPLQRIQGQEVALLPNISPSQAWVDMTAAEDTSLIQIRRKCFLRRSSIICQALFFFNFFSSTISMHKSSCWRFNRLSVPPQSGQERASAAAVLHFILV